MKLISILGLAALLAGTAAKADQLADIKARGKLICGTLGTAEPFSFRAADIFLESERASLDLDETEMMLKSVSEEWGVQPKGVMSFGNFMAKAGLLKAPPAK